MTYTESKRAPVIDWRARLDYLIAHTGDAAFLDACTNEAYAWVTCAVGNQCSRIPRERDGRPFDEKIRILGGMFYDRISDGEFGAARDVLEEIELRASKLLSEMEASA